MPEDRSENAAAPTSRRERRLAECFQRGVQVASGEKNYDYAHAMFAECVLHDPGNQQFVEALIKNVRARTPRPPKWRLGGGHRGLRQAAQRQDWPAVIRVGVERLKDDPWDVAALRAMAEASAALHHNEVELVYLKQALDAAPKNADVNRHCARSLARMGQFDQAIACWHRVETLQPQDAEAAKMISLLAEERLKYPGGRPPSPRQRKFPPRNPNGRKPPMKLSSRPNKSSNN